MINSHHDGPWASAVEDGKRTRSSWLGGPTGPPSRSSAGRTGSCSCCRAGTCRVAPATAYIGAHRAELEQVVLEVHLEHAALEFASRGRSVFDRAAGAAVVLHQPHPGPRRPSPTRWPPRARPVDDPRPRRVGEQPPTDGAFYHPRGCR